MMGVRYLKVPPTTWVMQFREGRIRYEGSGTSFFYFGPSSTIVAVPIASTDVPFIFAEATGDFQAVTVQGHVTYRVADPKKLATLLDFSVKPSGGYATDDPQKLPQRISLAAQGAIRAEIQARPLRVALVEADAVARSVRAVLSASPGLIALGIEILGLSILAIKPVPETARALEAEARERLLREADDALYSRRNNAVEQERKIRENELNTEVRVQEKQREIASTKLEGQIAIEERKKELVTREAENARTLADAQAYASEAMLKPLRTLDPKALQILASRGLDPRQTIALAFQEIGANAAKVGNLNISPDLLENLLQSPAPATRR